MNSMISKLFIFGSVIGMTMVILSRKQKPHELIMYYMPFVAKVWIGRILFFPTLYINQLENRLSGYARWNQIDKRIFLGSAPFASDVDTLYRQGIRGVINCCEEYNGPEEAYQEKGIKQLHIPTPDYTSPSLSQIYEAMDFIGKTNGKIYIHCKAGKGRSAIITFAYLLKVYRLEPDDAQRYLNKRRSQVSKNLYGRIGSPLPEFNKRLKD